MVIVSLLITSSNQFSLRNAHQDILIAMNVAKASQDLNSFVGGGIEKNASAGKLSRFLKIGGLFLGHSLIIIK